MRIRGHFPAALLAVGLIIASSASAQDTDGDGINDGYELAVGSNPLDPAIVPHLVPRGTDVVLATTLAQTEYQGEEPGLVWTGSEYGLAWSDRRNGAAEIYFRRLSAAGASIGPDVRVTFARWDSQTPALTWTGSEYAIVYHDWRDDGDGQCDGTGGSMDCTEDLYFSRVSSAGVKIGGDTRVFSGGPWDWDTLGGHSPSRLVWTGIKYVSVFSYFRAGLPNNPTIEQGVIDPNGVGSYSGIGTARAPVGSVEMVWTGSEAGVTWVQYSGGISSDHVKFLRVSASGTGIGSPLTVDEDAALFGGDTKVAWTGSEFLVSWNNGSVDKVQRVSAAGAKIGGNLMLSAAAGNLYQVGPCYFTSASGPAGDLIPAFQPGNPVSEQTPSFEPGTVVFTGPEYARAWAGGPLANKVCFSRFVLDRDGDGLADPDEIALGADPANWDSDHDGVSDGLEDNDGDGISNQDEIYLYHTNPNSWDSDGDHLPDKYEVDNAAHAGGGLDPMNALDAAADFDGDGNSNANEYFNGSDPWTKDPAPGGYANPGCYYWADADGDGTPAPSDIVTLKLQIAGAAQAYRDILPHGTDTLDLDRDGYAAPADLILLQLMIAGSERPGGYDSQASALEVVDAPTGQVAAGSTTHVTLSVHSVGGTYPYAPGFGVVFTVESGNAVLLGGDGTADGEAAENRYEMSMEAASGAKANMVVLVTGPWPVTIGAKIPACGTFPYGRWNDEVVLTPAVVINGP